MSQCIILCMTFHNILTKQAYSNVGASTEYMFEWLTIICETIFEIYAKYLGEDIDVLQQR